MSSCQDTYNFFRLVLDLVDTKHQTSNRRYTTKHRLLIEGTMAELLKKPKLEHIHYSFYSAKEMEKSIVASQDLQRRRQGEGYTEGKLPHRILI